MKFLTRLWSRAFLELRPSVSLGLFRLAVAWTVAAHMLPAFLHMGDNYLATAFKTKNTSFFPLPLLGWVDRSPEWLVWIWGAVFLAGLAGFALGWRTQRSAILMTLGCYYFYALNSLHIGTLSFDILLVTLCLVCATDYHGDFLSVDSLRRGKTTSYKRPRPFFLQRLLQLQVAWTFWYTALSKIAAGGNWLADHPYYYLMHYPPGGVVRDFPLRSWLATQPVACDTLSRLLLVFEFTVPFLWFIPRTRAVGIGLGIAFQFMLWSTLHVPTIFLFLFPPMMLLFIRPEAIVAWIESHQGAVAASGRALLLYDGQCGFCVESLKRFRVLDLFGWLDPLDFHRQPDLPRLHPALTPERCRSEMLLVEPNGTLSGGFGAFRRMCRRLPGLWILWPLVHLPGAGWLGTRAYAWIAAHRYLLHRHPVCQAHQCGAPIRPPVEPSQN